MRNTVFLPNYTSGHIKTNSIQPVSACLALFEVIWHFLFTWTWQPWPRSSHLPTSLVIHLPKEHAYSHVKQNHQNLFLYNFNNNSFFSVYALQYNKYFGLKSWSNLPTKIHQIYIKFFIHTKSKRTYQAPWKYTKILKCGVYVCNLPVGNTVLAYRSGALTSFHQSSYCITSARTTLVVSAVAPSSKHFLLQIRSIL